jgi:very-short-patch-repair endonuclease
MATLPEMSSLLDTCRYLATAPGEIDERALLDPVWQVARETIAEIVRLGQAQRTHRDRLAELCTEAAWSAEIAACRRDLAAHGRSWFRASHRDWRRARRELAALVKEPPPRSWNERLALLDALLETQEARRWLAENDGIGARAFGRLWRGADSDWPALAALERWESKGREQGLLAGAPALLARVPERERVAELASQLTRLIDALRGSCRELFGLLELDLAEAFGDAELDHMPLDHLEGRLRIWAGQIQGLQGWMAYRRLARQAQGDGLVPLVERLHDGRLKPARALDAFDVAVHQPLLRHAVRRFPCLGMFDGRSHEQLIARFAELDRERIGLARAEVARAHQVRLPRAESAEGQLGMLRREISKRRGNLPIRKLLAGAGGPVQAIKPVLLMSPLSVAELLAPGALRFDLLLIDEASQIEPAHALGAIARAEQMVVVGDHRQLPPTPLFRGSGADEFGTEQPGADDVGGGGVGEDEVGGNESASDLESILSLCAARGMPQRTLRRHYRSRHASLIDLSNRELYDGRLHVAPSPFEDDPELGLGLHHVADGVCDPGGAGFNAMEAEAVARAVVGHARRRPDLSLGVGCLSVPQRDAILGALERLRRATPELEPFFHPDQPEPFFVKDVRDVMLVSIAYARDSSGNLLTNFGPLAAEGGERRLNVLITRARRRLEVFSAITADDIDLARAGSRGAAALKEFLRYAQTGILEPAQPSARAAGSPFEEQVAAALAGLGHEVERQIGSAGFSIDLAIRDPERRGRYLLGIECEGAAWHGARYARDRDRLRQQVLEDRGWIVHRIWSIDWHRHPDRELARVQAAIDQARAVWVARDRAARSVWSEPSAQADDVRQAIPSEPAYADEARAIREDRCRVAGPNAPGETSPAFLPEPEIARQESIGALGVPYEEAEVALPRGTEAHLLPLEAMIDAVHRVVQVEGPVHEDEIARRIARACGRERTERRLAEAVGRGLAEALHSGLVACEGSFWHPAARDEQRVRDRSKLRSAAFGDRTWLRPPRSARRPCASSFTRSSTPCRRTS